MSMSETTGERNSERFLKAFAAIEEELERALNIKGHRPFYELVDRSTKKNPVIERYRFDLKKYGELRNALVHDRAGGEIIAEPNDYATSRIEHIAHLLLEPPRVIPLFRKDVLTLPLQASIARAIRELGSRSYTQLPVLEGEDIICLLTSNMIVRWIGLQLDGGSLDLEGTTLEEVVHTAGSPDNYIIVARAQSLLEIPDIFLRRQEEGTKLDAILINGDSKPAGPFLGIITNRDLPLVHRALEQNNEGLDKTKES